MQSDIPNEFCFWKRHGYNDLEILIRMANLNAATKMAVGTKNKDD